MILAAGVLPVATIMGCSARTRVAPLKPFQLNADGEGWARDWHGRVHPLSAGHEWVQKVTDLRIDGRKLENCLEFNLEEGWARCWEFTVSEGKFPNEYLVHGKITVDWHRG